MKNPPVSAEFPPVSSATPSDRPAAIRNFFFRSRYGRVLLAVLSVIPALGLWMAALPISSQIPYMPFFLSVLFSAWYLGFGAGMTATITSTMAVEYFIHAPTFAFSADVFLPHLAFLTTGTLMSALAAGRRSTEGKLTELKEHLERRVAERTFQLEERIEKQKAAEEILRQQAMLLQLSHDAIIVRGYEDRRVRFWSRGAAEVYGWSESEAMGKIIPDLLRARYPELLEQIERRLQQVGNWDGEVTHTRKNGSELIVESRWSLQRNLDGEPVAILELNSDITAKKQAEQRAQNSERLAALGTAAAVFAHEIANPLNGISTSLEIVEDELRNKNELDADIRATFQLATKEIRRLTALLDELRTFARPQKLNLQRADLVEVIEEVLIPETPSFSAASVAVERQFENGLPPVLLDQEKIKQVLLNLCKNAVDAMPNGGVLTVKAYRENKAVVIEIQDTGDGIAEGIDIFQLFATTKPTGTGVGLPVVRQIIGAHRGKIEYASQPSKGTAFKVTLPIRE